MGFLSSIGNAIGNGVQAAGKFLKPVGDFLSSGTGIGTLISAGTGILGNLLSKNSNDSANRTNMQIAQMNNEFNERMLDKQMRYNSLQGQFDQAREVGANPFLMNGAGTVGSTASAAANPTVKPMNWDFSTVGNAIQAGIQTSKENEMLTQQVEGLRIDNQYRKQQIIKQLVNMDEQNLSMQAKRRIDEITARSLDDLNRSIIANNYASEKEKLQNVDESTARTLLLDKQLAKFDEKFDYEKSLAVAQTLRLCAARDFDKQKTRTEVYHTLVQQFGSAYAKQNYRNLVRMSDYIVNKAHTEQYQTNPLGALFEIFDNN